MNKKTCRPNVTLKFVRTLDGYIATKTGDSKWISSLKSRKFAHKLRSQHDAVLVGVNTVLKDDPLLNVRMVKGRNPIKIIVDSRLRTPLTARVLKNQPQKTILAVTKNAQPRKIKQVQKLGAKVLMIPADRNGQVDLKKLLLKLSKIGTKSMLVEGGAKIITNFLKNRLADRLVIITAPKIIGKGLPAVNSPNSVRLPKTQLTAPRILQLGDDLVIDAMLK